MLLTSLHVFWIAIKTTRNNAVAPAGKNMDKQEDLQIQESVQKLYVGIKNKIVKVYFIWKNVFWFPKNGFFLLLRYTIFF